MTLLLTTFFDPGTESSIWNLSSGEDLLWVIIMIFVTVGTALLLTVTVYLAVMLNRALNPPEAVAAKPADTRSLWQRLAGLHNLKDEASLTIQHSYDGITELDNPTPPWFMALFYSTIAFSFGYWIYFHVIGNGNIMEQEYTQEVAIAEKQRTEFIKLVAGKINENTVTLLNDAKGIDAGKALFTQHCTACHGQNAEGRVGPNLTDEYWIHGNTIKNVYHTVSAGVPEKGMIPWNKQLNPLQIQQVASYVLSLQGTKPADAKEPQGDKMAPADSTAGKVAMR